MKVITLIILTTFLILGANISSHSQTLDNYLRTGKLQMEQGDYESANITFRKILALDTILPSQFCYYFAETLYMVGQYQNSKSFINKYYELTGIKGRFYENVTNLEKMVELEISNLSNCQFCDPNGYRLETCAVCDGHGVHNTTCSYCRGKGLILCQQCKGHGVEININQYGENEYKSCKICQTRGYVVCPTCKGNKISSVTCQVCNGLGKTSSAQVCNHKPSIVNQ